MKTPNLRTTDLESSKGDWGRNAEGLGLGGRVLNEGVGGIV